MDIYFLDPAGGPDLNKSFVKPRDTYFSFFKEGNTYSKFYTSNIQQRNQLLYPST